MKWKDKEVIRKVFIDYDKYSRSVTEKLLIREKIEESHIYRALFLALQKMKKIDLDHYIYDPPSNFSGIFVNQVDCKIGKVFDGIPGIYDVAINPGMARVTVSIYTNTTTFSRHTYQVSKYQLKKYYGNRIKILGEL